MRIYYQDDHVQVTSTAIWVEGKRYRLGELENVWRAGGSVAGKAVLVGLAVVAGGGLFRLVGSYAWWFGGLGSRIRKLATAGAGDVAALAVGVLLAAVLSIVALEAVLLGVEHIRDKGRHRELWACVGGSNVLLLRTNDTARFERVRRALVRALDDLARA